VLWSFYHHHSTQVESFYTALNEAGGLGIKPFEPPRKDIVEYYREWLERNGYPNWSFWENIATWW
jgi:aryl sulfotransferase